MKNGAWRPSRPLFCTLVGMLTALPVAARADAAADFVAYYQGAYATGRDLVPVPQTTLDTSSIATQLDLKSVIPQGVVSGSAFLAADGTIIKLAGIQGCLSTTPIDYAGVRTTCAMISMAGMTAVVESAKSGAGDVFPCHALGERPGRPTVRFAECFYMQDGGVRSLSETLIAQGFAFAARDKTGRPVFPEYARTEEAARSEKVGIWATASFIHPYGERYRANPSTR